jgi:hypothetical protein
LAACWCTATLRRIIIGQQEIPPLGAPLALYKILWSVQKLRRLSLIDTNIAPIRNKKNWPASSFTFSPVQLYSTSLVGNDKNTQLKLLSQRKLA